MLLVTKTSVNLLNPSYKGEKHGRQHFALKVLFYITLGVLWTQQDGACGAGNTPSPSVFSVAKMESQLQAYANRGLNLLRNFMNTKGYRIAFHSSSESHRDILRIVSVNYLFGRPLIPYNFLKGIFTTNVRDMGTDLGSSVFRLIKMCF